MKCQVLFSLKNKQKKEKKEIECKTLSTTILLGTLKVKKYVDSIRPD